MKITIDHREKNSLVPTQLMKLGFNVEFKQLKVADYIVKGIAIERKTIQDFLNSMMNKHLSKQLHEMQQYNKKLLIIEGIEHEELYSEEGSGINPNAVRGFLLSILLKYNIPIIFTKNPQDTARFIYVLANKPSIEPEKSFKPSKKNLSSKEQKQFILEGFPGVGPKTAKKLLDKFGNLRNILNASLDQLQEVLGKKAQLVYNIVEEHY